MPFRAVTPDFRAMRFKKKKLPSKDTVPENIEHLTRLAEPPILKINLKYKDRMAAASARKVVMAKDLPPVRNPEYFGTNMRLVYEAVLGLRLASVPHSHTSFKIQCQIFHDY